MTLRRDRVALNAIQWINVKADPADPDSDDLWLYADPAFRADYPRVLGQVRESGFEAVMLEVLGTQTLQDYARMVTDAGLALAPGYASIAIPSDHGAALPAGSADRAHWFDGVRRKAEESSFFGLGTVFLAPEVGWGDAFPRTSVAAAVGAEFSPARLDEQIEFLAEATDVLAAEGVRAGLHNHVGTWVETEDEIERVLAAIPRLGASFDIGHLEWAGIDARALLTRHADRVVDLHLKDLDLEVAAASRSTPAPYRAAVDRGLFAEPGAGGLDLDAILACLPADFDGWVVVEVDRTRLDPLASARISWAWVQERLAPPARP